MVHGRSRGRLQVINLEEKPASDIGSFSKEEKKLF